MLKQFFITETLNRFSVMSWLMISMGVIALTVTTAYSQTSSSLPVYTKQGKVFVADVLGNKPYQVVSVEGQWSLIKFDQATVPVWVSDDYVVVEEGIATVTARSALNARMRPSLQSRILTRLPSGYKTPVIATLAGFVNIYAPADLVMAIQNDTSLIKKSEGINKVAVKQNKKGIQAGVDSWSIRPPKIDDKLVEVGVSKKTASALAPPITPATTQSQNSAIQTSIGGTKSSLLTTTTDRLHKIAPGDAITVFVFGEQDLSASDLLVPESGSVSLPLIGSIDVQGKTVSEIEATIAQRLSQGYVKNPKLSVTISSYRPIFIRGAVNSTGSFPYSAGLTIAKAIALAGGTKSFARVDGVSILRDGAYVEENLYLDSQYQIKSGDVITISEEGGLGGQENAFIYLHGEVNNAGEYVYRKGLTVEKAIVLAGGFSLRASQRKVTVTRYTEGQDEPTKLKRVKLYLPVEAGDVIKVGARLF